ncbi:SGNH/GDSL hydrolase family protein [Clavibacter sp. VKM Ac-2542]|uniref:SGNH/GDSL hydrolase family protein n=1 Tax=Clavibacter sp. VKM Ac-2542 TaxID=2783811 RepID=UPI00188CD433|nr:SGNH/GDSL hydrolase family protein [Clavibacter sp. VKM Ac-2542]MBF4620855.1 SGNH/GDSL hydrolase family protein [Clavibacter sp. VKM Ac-2542]
MVLAVSVAAGLLTGTGATASDAAPSPTAARTAGALPAEDDASQVAPVDRDRLLGTGWKDSRDRATTAIGNPDGFTIYAADASAGYAWAPVATLSVPGVETDRWIGNTCLTQDGSRMGVVYGTRAMTNDPRLFDAGAWGAIVDMASGQVTQLGRGFSLAYFDPGCGTGDDVVMTAFTEDAQTRLVRVDASAPEKQSITALPFEAASAIPVASGIVAGASGSVVHVSPDGTTTTLAAASGVPYDMTTTDGDDVLFVDKQDATASVRSVPSEPTGEASHPAPLATGPVADLGIERDAAGHAYVTGKTPTVTGDLPTGTSLLRSPTTAGISSTGQLVVTGTTDTSGATTDSTDQIPPVKVNATSAVTQEDLAFVVPPGQPDSAGSPGGSAPAAGAGRVRTQSLSQSAAAVVGDPHNPIESEATCAIPRNNPADQAMQPKPRQVEWAVDQAVTGTLDKPRTSAYLANAGLNGSTPQGMFPRVALAGGGNVPAQVMLGIIAQESNLWQASRYTTPGVTGNPLVGNFYGNDVSSASFSWTADFSKSDCGYGVAQITDGMRKAGTGQTARPAQAQRAIALDYASNVAAGLQIISQKWNDTRAAGLVVNDGNPAYVENWFYAIWAYNSGFHPESEKAANGGAWGVGWSNNPANPKYAQNRAPFLELGAADASRPQNWPYPEKVLGFAAWSLQLYEDATKAVTGFVPSWWNTEKARTEVKPPVDLFCVASVDDCDPTTSQKPTAPGLSGEPAGPCTHADANGQLDLRCWMHGPVTWKGDCASTCGHGSLRFSAGYAEQADGTAFAPDCAVQAPRAGSPQVRDTLPSSALVVDDTTVAPVRPCTRQTTHGTFQFTFGAGAGGYPSKIDTHQLGARWNSHFWFAHTRQAGTDSDLHGALDVTGRWTLDRSLAGKWTRVFVHLPDHGAWTQQASYAIDLGDGKIKNRVIPQRTQANAWVSLGVFPMNGIPTVSLSNLTHDGDGVDDIAWDAVAFQPLAAKPDNIVVAMGDSYSSGEGSSESGGGNFYRETDLYGAHSTSSAPAYDSDVANNRSRNACHRSDRAWSREATLPGNASPIGDLADTYDSSMDYHLIACSGALTQHVLPYYSVAPSAAPSVVYRNNTLNGQFGKYREVSQLDSGFLDENTTLVTISIGGNDARFSEIVAACVSLLTDCETQSLPGDTEKMPQATAERAAKDVTPAVTTVRSQIHKKAPNAKVLVMGYPNVFGGDVIACMGIPKEEGDWLRGASLEVNEALKDGTSAANSALGSIFATFQDPVPYFAGHEVCTSDNYLNGIRTDLSPGDDPNLGPYPFHTGVTSAQSVHPNALGQAAYARAMTDALK